MSIIFLRFYFNYFNYLELTQFDLILFIYSFWLPIITLVNKRKLIFLKSLTVKNHVVSPVTASNALNSYFPS